MNKTKIIKEAKAFLDRHFEELSEAYSNFLKHQYQDGCLEEIDKRLKKINEYVCFCAGNQLFIDNTFITSSRNIIVFKNFIFIYHRSMTVSCNKSKRDKLKITYYRGGYIIPIEESHCLGKELYCYTKPSIGQIGIRTEKDLQDYFINRIESLDNWKCYRLSPMKYGKGVPDVLVKKPNGEPVYIELKTPQETGVLKMDQIIYHEKLRDRGKTVKIFWKKEQLDEFLKNENVFNKTGDVANIQNSSLCKSVKDFVVAAISFGMNYLTFKKNQIVLEIQDDVNNLEQIIKKEYTINSFSGVLQNE